MICDDYSGVPWELMADACWQSADLGQKLDLAASSVIFASVAFAFVLGFMVTRK